MVADFAGLFEQDYAEVVVAGFVGELFELYCGAETGGTCSRRAKVSIMSWKCRDGCLRDCELLDSPPPTMQTSTSSDSRSMASGSSVSSSSDLLRGVLLKCLCWVLVVGVCWQDDMRLCLRHPG